MIIDKIENIRNYAPILKNLDAALAAMDALEEKNLGRYEFDGGFFMIQAGPTGPLSEGKFETHRKYIDVQIMIEGSEEVGWQDVSDLETIEAYDPDKDMEFYKGSYDHMFKVLPGMFYAVFPNDGHAPCRHTSEPQHYKKYVVKLPV